MDEEVTDLTEVDDSMTDFVWTLCTDFDVETDFVAAVTFIDCSTRLLLESFTERISYYSCRSDCENFRDP